MLKQIKMLPNIGFSVVDENADPQNPDVVVVLGDWPCLNLDVPQRKWIT